jgi:hypothetical protein
VNFAIRDALDGRRRLDPEDALRQTELALRSYCLHKNIDPSIFTITSRELGRLLGLTPRGALKRIEKLGERGPLTIFDHGTGMRLPLLVGLADGARANVKLIDAMVEHREQRKAAIHAKRARKKEGVLKFAARNGGAQDAADFVQEAVIPL